MKCVVRSCAAYRQALRHAEVRPEGDFFVHLGGIGASDMGRADRVLAELEAVELIFGVGHVETEKAGERFLRRPDNGVAEKEIRLGT